MTLVTVPITTDAAGAASQRITGVVGRFVQARYVPHATTPLDTAADIDLVGASTGVILIAHDDIGTAAFTRSYRQATHGVDGSASLYAGSGEPIEDGIYVSGEDLTFTVAAGGDTKSGTFYFWFA